MTKGFTVSENLNYIFTPKGVVQVFSENKDSRYKSMIPYTMDNIDIAFNILKENLLFKYETRKIDLVEYSNYPRKVLYRMLEIFKPNNNLYIINEWEKKYGNKLLLINESYNKLIIEDNVNNSINHIKIIVEQWYNPLSKDFAVWQAGKNVAKAATKAGNWVYDQGKQIGQKGLFNYVGEKAKSAWNYISNSIASAWNCVTSGIECIMEGLRGLLFSTGGAAIMAGVSTLIPIVGQIANAVLYGALLIWDIYKMFSGKYGDGSKYHWSYMDILMDMLAMIPSMSLIAKGGRTIFAGARSFFDIGKIAAKQGGVYATMVNTIKSSINTITGLVSKAATFIGDKLGLKSLADWGSKTTAKVMQFSDELAAGAKGGTQPITSTVKTSLKSLSTAERSAYDKLLGSWQTQQKNLGKYTKPNPNDRAKLIAQAKQNLKTPINLKEKMKKIWAKELAQKRGTLGKTGKATLSAGGKYALFCAAMGIEDVISCRNKDNSGEFTPKEKAKAEAEVKAAEQSLANEMEQNIGDIELTGDV